MKAAHQVDFRELVTRAGTDEGARVSFQRLITALVHLRHPYAKEVRADPGDWGIDTYVGSLADGVHVWQSKCFLNEVGNSQKQQIRESFDSVIKCAKEHGHKILSWTLCLPLDMSPAEKKWWDNKKNDWSKLHRKMPIMIWEASDLRQMLRLPDAARTLQDFFGAVKTLEAPAIVDRPPEESYEGTLFVRQLSEAGIREIDSQKTAFFNADLLARDVSDRGLPDQIRGLHELDRGAHMIWEVSFGSMQSLGNTPESCSKALFSTVMKEIGQMASHDALPVHFIHKAGMMHRIVDGGRAGWVEHWREIMAQHSKGTA